MAANKRRMAGLGLLGQNNENDGSQRRKKISMEKPRRGKNDIMGEENNLGENTEEGGGNLGEEHGLEGH